MKRNTKFKQVGQGYLEPNTCMFIEIEGNRRKITTFDGTLSNSWTASQLDAAFKAISKKYKIPLKYKYDLFYALIAEMMYLWCSVNTEKYYADIDAGKLGPTGEVSFAKAIQRGYINP
jgi:hypothetical protein